MKTISYYVKCLRANTKGKCSVLYCKLFGRFKKPELVLCMTPEKLAELQQDPQWMDTMKQFEAVPNLSVGISYTANGSEHKLMLLDRKKRIAAIYPRFSGVSSLLQNKMRLALRMFF